MHSVLTTKSPPRDRVPGRKSILLWVENFGGTGSVSKEEEDDHGPLEHQRTLRLSDGLFRNLPGTLHANMRPSLASQIVLFVEFFTKTSTSILTRWLLFKNLHNRTDLPEKRHFVARALTRFNPLRLFLVGVSKDRSV